MSMRGVKFQFQSGEPVLCFEPDHTKARVLYNAKVLDLTVGHGSDGTRQPDYLVHFQGWNSSWDRIVPESLILSNSEENKQLMKLLASAARKKKTNSKRKRKIEVLLHKHLAYNPDLAVEYSDTDNSGEEEITDTEVDAEDPRMRSTDEEGTDISDNEISFKDQTMSKAVVEVDILEEEEIEPREVILELPEKLKRRLEDDCYFICRNNKVVQLPASPNVITVLEGYVKNFTANFVYTKTVNRHGRRDKDKKPLPTNNIELIKEVVDGIRLLFDFSLSPILLYNSERQQHKAIINNYIPPEQKLSEIPTEKGITTTAHSPSSEPEVHSPRLRSASCKSSTPPQSSTSPTTKTSPTRTLRGHNSPRATTTTPNITATIKCEPIDTSNILDHDLEEISPHRRLTRNIFSDFSARKRGGGSPDREPKTARVDFEDGGHESRRESLRSSGCASGVAGTQQKHVNSSCSSGGVDINSNIPTSSTRHSRVTGVSNINSNKDNSTNVSLKDRVVPPAPLNVTAAAAISSAFSSKDSTTSSQNTPNQVSDSSSSMVYCNGYKTKEAAMNHIFSWNLVPEEVYEMSPVPPSVVYGAHHLLRLFVKIPDILGKMAIPEHKFEYLMEHMEQFVEYMSERSEELFPDSVYISNNYKK